MSLKPFSYRALILVVGIQCNLDASNPQANPPRPFLPEHCNQHDQTFPVIDYPKPISALYRASRAGLFPLDACRVAVISDRRRPQVFPKPGSSELDSHHESILHFIKFGEAHK